MTTLYYPVEEALLHDYFGMERPDWLRGLDIWRPDVGTPKKAVHLEPTSSGLEDDERALENAVARIALSRIQNRLPQWAGSCGEGLVFGRAIREETGSSVLLLPLHLFTLNWADSGPGFSWPEAYHVTWFPVFSRYVVTASADITDAWGYEDRAIGFFKDSFNVIERAKSIIIDFWQWQYNEWDQQRWEYLFDTGALDADEAERLADAVWSPPEEDEEEWHDECQIRDF
jgi:hypothetical protein